MFVKIYLFEMLYFMLFLGFSTSQATIHSVTVLVSLIHKVTGNIIRSNQLGRYELGLTKTLQDELYDASETTASRRQFMT